MDSPRKEKASHGSGLGASFGYALSGIFYCWHTQRNFRIEVVLGCFTLSAAVYLGASLVPILLCCMGVLCLEMCNTALESVVDLLAPEWMRAAQVAKDVSAGAVLISVFFAIWIGLLELVPPFLLKLEKWIN